MQTASGLAAAHAQGLVHRDVKPSNILLENGIQRVKLTDFGLARAVDDASLTQSGVIAGTPQYMAPEQANGDAVDHRADLFSLGSVMYAMCVGHSPFRASTTMGVLKRVCHDPARPIQELNPDIPEWLCAIVMKLLSKERDARFQTAKSVAEVLEKWLAHVQQPTVVPRPSPVDAAASSTKQTSTANFASAANGAVPSGGAFSMQDASRRLADSRTILFQHISPRLLLFLFLGGMAGSYAFATERRIGSEESLVVSVLGGLFACFWGLLFVSLVRLVWANVYGTSEWMTGRPSNEPHSTSEHNANRPRSLWSLPPESLAMLAALVTMVFGGHFFFAVIVAIVVWRIATYYARIGELQPAALVDGDATRVDVYARTKRPSLAARVNSVLHATAVVLQRLGEAVGSVFDLEPAERNRLLIAIGWCFAGGMDVIGSAYFAAVTMKESGGDAPIGFLFVLLSLGMILLSLAVAQCLYVRQNFNLVRGASVIGLLPVSYGAIVRIPLSVITLLWQHAPSVRASFATMPWPETDLGRLLARLPVGQLSQTVRRWIGTLGRTALWSVLCFVLFLLTLALYVIPFGPSDYYVRDDSAQTVQSKGDGPQFGFSMMATGTGRTYGLLPPSHIYLRDTILLTAPHSFPSGGKRSYVIPGFQIRLGYPATTNKGGRSTRPFTKEHCQELFQEISGQPHPQHAESLFQTIQWINAARDSGVSSLRTPAELFSSGSSISVEDWMNQLRRTFLHAEPLHANRPLPGFVAASTLLNQELFDVRPGVDQQVSNSCMTTPWLLATLLIGFPLLWLMGVWRIVARRHGKRETTETTMS